MQGGCMSSDAGGAIIVFDGVCHLCNGWVHFLLRHDRRGVYRFASMQSEVGCRLLRDHGLDPADPSSFLLLRAGRARTDSDAIIDVLTGLGGPWRLFGALRLMPRVLRDPLYRGIARNRYRRFGKREFCMMPAPEVAARFLD
ncbi:thiol-disulfide oxidoreductase DCC family protein [Dokdonella sp.]|uniref:thiol-disulfide oxidoreductase DCC family protein n=1 Tax=Dokdonella sp. TaxID=2291710 RepID=UPI0027BA12A4|nr:thiol-disulfide oxidoreductase DCC family protein [Dokdonella sp.]